MVLGRTSPVDPLMGAGHIRNLKLISINSIRTLIINLGPCCRRPISSPSTSAPIMHAIDFALPIIALAVATLLLLPAIKENTIWRASVTPLASIIGSGFLVIAPLLVLVVGRAAPWAMVAIVSPIMWGKRLQCFPPSLYCSATAGRRAAAEGEEEILRCRQGEDT